MPEENAKGRGTIVVDGRTYDEACGCTSVEPPHPKVLQSKAHDGSLPCFRDARRPTAWRVTLSQGRSRKKASKKPALKSCAFAALANPPAGHHHRIRTQLLGFGAQLRLALPQSAKKLRNAIMEGCRQHFAQDCLRRCASCCCKLFLQGVFARCSLM